MYIKDMFFKEIDREINGVIKVGQKDKENVYQELDEYVVTEELEKYMNRFFDAYKRGLVGRTDKMGVWISGFFGSGKSHFLKIISYILSDKVVANPDDGSEHTASSFFLDGIKVTDKKLQEKIREVASYSGDTDVILFNVDSKSASDSKTNKEAIKDVFMKVFNDYLGYCGSIPFLADFERKLDEDGNYKRFKDKFFDINGSSWEEAREDYYFIQDEIIETVSTLGIMSEDAAKNWAANAESSYSFSVDQFAEYVRSYCEKKGDNHHVVFLVDEVGQYIADDSKLMVNLQTVAEDLGTACQGKVWIAVTSQQDIDSITKTMGDDFSKIQGRFNTRISLTSADVAEVIRKRILFKKDHATAILKDLYNQNESVINNIITFSEGTPHMPLYEDADDFAEVYPFIPYQFKLLGDVLTSIRQYSSSGKHMADGERSMLALFKEAAQKFEDEREGILVPFNAFYSAVDDFIDHTHRIVIATASRNPRLNAFDVELLKVLFMIKHVNTFKGDVENLTTLMISSISEDTLELKKKVEVSLRQLCDEMLVQKNGDRYVFLTNEEQEAEIAIRHIYVDPTDTVNHVAQVAFEEVIVLPNNKYRYSNRYQFSFNTKIDDRFYKNNNANGITLHLLTAYSGEEDDVVLGMLSAQERSVVVRMSDNYPYLTETESMKKIEAFLNKPELTALTDYEVIQANKRKERSEIAKRVKDYVRMSLETSDIYVNGEKVSTKSKDVTARINEAFEKLVGSVYSKLADMESEPTLSDIQDLLRKNKTQMTLDLTGTKEPNSDALRELIDAVRYAGKTGAKFSLKTALDKFMAAPYGYTEEDVEYLIATLYKQGKISLKMNSVIYSPASTAADDAFKYLTKREFREKILLELKEVPPNAWVQSVKEIIHDFFGRTVMTDDTDSLMRDFRSYCTTKKAKIEEILKDDYGKDYTLPGKAILEKAVRLIDTVMVINDPMTFYKRVHELYDDFEEVADQMVDLNGFLGGPQKEKYLKAVRTLQFYEASKNYISDEKIIDYAKQIQRIMAMAEPYSYIKKMEEYDGLLSSAIVELLEKDAERIKPELYVDEKLVQAALISDRPYSTRLKQKFHTKFDELHKKLDCANDMAKLNGIPAESSALVQNCLNEINREEEAYQISILPPQPQTDSGDTVKTPVKPVIKPAIKQKPVSIRTLTKNKTYSIRTEADVDAFLQEMRKSLMDELDDNTIIRLS
ncbi:MAG: BREX system P-loop protein BrxC [Parasporobacterium sp.]|nr:BREX system P-loop protein BrxC [Parasporobacterium sp.]